MINSRRSLPLLRSITLSSGLALASWSGVSNAETPAPEAPSTEAGEAAPGGDAGASSGQEYKTWPAKVVLLPVEEANLEEGAADAFATLFTQAYEDEVGGRVMPPAEASEAMEALGSASAVLQASGADSYLKASVVRLDSHIVITVSRLGPDGTRLKKQRMTAASVDDFESISERLAKALNGEESVEETRTMDNVTRKEGKKPNRVFADDRVGFRGGVVIPVSESKLSPLVSAAIDIRYESERHFAGFAIGLLLPGPGEDPSYGGLTAEVNAAYYLTHTAFAPYLGGNVTARVLGGGANLAPGAILGLGMNRDSGAAAFLELRLNQNVIPIEIDSNPDAFEEGTITYEYPFEPSLNAGIAW